NKIEPVPAITISPWSPKAIELPHLPNGTSVRVGGNSFIPLLTGKLMSMPSPAAVFLIIKKIKITEADNAATTLQNMYFLGCMLMTIFFTILSRFLSDLHYCRPSHVHRGSVPILNSRFASWQPSYRFES